MMPPSKLFDPVVGIDIHIIQPPGPVPPLPVPHPFVGLMLDIMQFAPIIGSKVYANGLPTAIVGINCKGIPKHIPIGGTFVTPPSSDGELFMGSSTVSFDGDAAGYMALPAITCQSVGMPKPVRANPKKMTKTKGTMLLPTSIVLPIPGRPITVGGSPTISLMALGMRFLGTALGKFARSKLFKKIRQKLFKKMKPGFLKCKIFRAEPVNGITGEVFVEQSDFTIDGRIPIEWNRNYGSHNTYRGSLGNGWQAPADIRLEIDTDGHVLFYDGGPGATLFPGIPRDTYSIDKRCESSGQEDATQPDTITELQDGAKLSLENGSFSVHTKEGKIYRFERLLQRLKTDLQEPVIVYIQEIADEYDNYLRFVRNEKHELTRIDESAGRSIIVKSRGGLIRELWFSHPDEAEKPRPLVSYEYDGEGNLVTVFDALKVPYRFFYENGLLVRHMDRNGLSFYYEYDSRGKEAKCIHAWGDGGLYDYLFDFKPGVTTFTDSLGNRKSLHYNSNNLPVMEKDELGVVAMYEYDDVGRTTAVIDGNENRTEYVYDALGNMVELTRPDGTSLAITYDDGSNPVTITDPNGNDWNQQWNDRHRLLEQVSPESGSTRYEYDASGQLKTVTDARNFQSHVQTDAFANIETYTDALGNISRFETDVFGNVTKESSAGNRTSQYTYDAKSRLVGIINPSGTRIECVYDGEDNLIRHVDEAGQVTKFVYRGLGEVAKRINADGTVVTYERDTEEQLVAVVNERGQKYRLLRDPRGRILEEIDYWGKSRNYTYDNGGNLLQVRDPLDRITTFTSDTLGRLTSKNLYDGKTETFTYDPNGNLVAHENEHAKNVREFDAENRLIEEAQGDFRVQSDYDENGNRVRRRTSSGNDVVYRYDGNNQVISIQINDQPSMEINRDADGFTTSEIMAGHLRRRYEYNPDGLLTRQEISNANYGYRERRYEYDPVGNLTAKIDSARGRTSFTYDPMGRIKKSINPKSRIEEFLYDPVGDLLQSDHQFDKETGLRKSTYKGTDYYFNAAGSLVQKEGQDRKLTFEWDGNDRLVKAESNTGQVTEIGYDAQGRRLFKQTGEKHTIFQWDGEQLVSDNVDRQGEREFVYYPDSFEPFALINSDRKVYYYQNDAVGLPQELCSPDGPVVWSADYETFEKDSVDDDFTIDNPLRFQGQYYDEDLGLNYNRFRYFDPEIGAFISQDPLGLEAGENLYRYAPNCWGWVDPLGLKCKNPIFSDLKDHARRHSNLNPSKYFKRAVQHTRNARNFLFRHDGKTKRAFISRLDSDLFRFTSTTKSVNRIFTHMDVDAKYLRNIGITLPKGF